MDNAFVCLCFLAGHLALCALVYVFMLARRVRLSKAHMLWTLSLPLFGPLLALALVRSASRAEPDPLRLTQTNSETALSFGSQLLKAETVPLEEALLINNHRQRRAFMMSALRSEPMRYLDFLLMARFHEDVETSHYAAFTIMDLQRHIQMDIRQLQVESSRNPGNLTKRREHIELLAEYCDTGLLEGQLLRRQRLILQGALEEALALREEDDLLILALRNCLSLGQPQEARQYADRLLSGWFTRETSWLEALRVAVEAKDLQEVKTLLEAMRTAPIEWTLKGREQVSLWMEAKL